MLAALIAGQRDPKVLTRLARGPICVKRSVVQEALTGHFTDHHAYRARWCRADMLDGDIAELDHKRDKLIAWSGWMR